MMRNAYFILLSLSLAAQGLAADEPSPVIAHADDGTVPLESEIPFELDPLSVTTERMAVRQEAGYRMMRQALERERSSRRRGRFGQFPGNGIRYWLGGSAEC